MSSNALQRTEEELIQVASGEFFTLKEILSDQWLRLNNLYWTKNKDGEKVIFTPWEEQEEFYWGMHYLNIILKARQRGITHIIQIFMLDVCLFNDNVSAGVIAHTKGDAQKFFRNKIKFAYENLPESLKAYVSATNKNANELIFANGSSISVGTSMRSDTLQYLHISEYGKICAKWPEKAEEIKTGALNTVLKGNFIFIESTSEGAHGDFYDKCDTAEKLQLADKTLTDMDYKFFFFPWWRAPEYVLDQDVDFTEEEQNYFHELNIKHGIILNQNQKAWYVKKLEEQGDLKMPREFPSTPDESFRAIVEGAVYGKQMRQVRKDQRILDIPVVEGIPVNTFWDIGRDMTAIWFHQRVGPENRFIDYYQELNQSLPYFIKLLLVDRNERFHKYHYGTHYMPHDIGNIDYSRSDQKTRKRVAEDLGLSPIRVVERIQSREEGIDMTRRSISTCYFDETRCQEGIKGLENYRYEYDEKREGYSKEPLHNWASHPADSIRQFAQGYRYSPYSNNEDDDNPLSRGYRRKTRKNSNEWRI